MTSRKIISLSIAICFGIIFVTGILSFINDYSRPVATIHTVFGLLLTIGVLFHFKNNFNSIKKYGKGRIIFVLSAIGVLLFYGAWSQVFPFQNMMDFGAQLKANSKKEINTARYEMIEMNIDNDISLSIDLLRAEHYWHPQMAIWTEDSLGNYLQTLFVSKATAKGLFFGGRNKENFKNFDEEKDAVGEYRRVDALPVWSHKRGVQYEDGMFVPTFENQLPDAITGATIPDNFHLTTSTKYQSRFKLKIELNVAFDDNEFYSEFDFPDDEIFHNGTGQMGQPSIIFETEIDMKDAKKYYLMELIGHGHHSGQTGEVYTGLSTLTTALEIVERIVIGIDAKNPQAL